MISDAETNSLSAAAGATLSLRAPAVDQPIADVRSYLEARTPQSHWKAEENLFVTLPSAIRSDLRILLGTMPGGGAFGHIARASRTSSVQAAVADARRLYPDLTGSLKRIRARYDLWAKTGDWTSLVNCAKAGAAWQKRKDGLPVEFLRFCASRFGKFKRADGKRQALLAIKRQWRTGRNSAGEREPIPGYGYREEWLKKNPATADETGWGYSNILAQVKALNAFPKAVRALLHESTAAARSFLPGVRFDRNRTGTDLGPIRFLEEVQFDDVKADFLILDPESGQVCDLWLLVARDLGTGILLGFGLRPARTREDGTQEHLRLRDMKQLCGWILERYGLPPYLMVWKIEHGTATLTPGTRAALREMLPDRIDISYSSMIGGPSPAGYRQRAIGNSKGKASLESQNRLMHTMSAGVPGQTGPLYTKRPADLAARAKEAAEIWATTQHLPAHLRNQVGFPILTINQAREHLFQIFKLQNERTEHELQGFDDVVEIWDNERNLWVPQSALSSFASAENLRARKRKESPLERCARLVAPYRDEWTAVSPEIISAFYEHTARLVPVKDNGHIDFTVDGRSLEYQPGPGAAPQIPGTKLLAYFHPDAPSFLYLTDGRGSFIGTWVRTTAAVDEDTLSAAIRYSQGALKAAKQAADELAAPERADLDAMRARNAELLAANTFVEVAESTRPRSAASTTPVAAGLASTAATRAQLKRAEKTREDIAAAARENLRRAVL